MGRKKRKTFLESILLLSLALTCVSQLSLCLAPMQYLAAVCASILAQFLVSLSQMLPAGLLIRKILGANITGESGAGWEDKFTHSCEGTHSRHLTCEITFNFQHTLAWISHCQGSPLQIEMCQIISKSVYMLGSTTLIFSRRICPTIKTLNAGQFKRKFICKTKIDRLI